jgi:hypothetical protein
VRKFFIQYPAESIDRSARQAILHPELVVWDSPIVYQNINLYLTGSCIPGRENLFNHLISSNNRQNQ